MLHLSKNFNKALLPLGYKASISHIIEKFPKEIEIITAVGHEKKKCLNTYHVLTKIEKLRL